MVITFLRGGGVDRNSNFKSEGNLVINSKVTNQVLNIVHGLSADYYSSYSHPSEAGSKVTLDGPVAISLNTNKNTTAYGIASYGNSSIVVNDDLSISLDVSQAANSGVSKFVGVYSGITVKDSWIDKKGMNGGSVCINKSLGIYLPTDVKEALQKYPEQSFAQKFGLCNRQKFSGRKIKEGF